MNSIQVLALSQGYTNTQIIETMEQLEVIGFRIVDALPTKDISPSIIYLVLKSATGDSKIYDEYIRVQDQWIHLSTTEINLVDYAKLDQLSTIALSGDYRDLSNSPIVELGNNSVIANQANGIYTLVGQYKIADNDPTLRATSNRIMFFVKHEGTATYVKEINGNYIKDYAVTANDFVYTSYVTAQYLVDQKYCKPEDVERIISELNYITRDEAVEIINELFDQTLVTRMDLWLLTKLATDEEVREIFGLN